MDTLNSQTKKEISATDARFRHRQDIISLGQPSVIDIYFVPIQVIVTNFQEGIHLRVKTIEPMTILHGYRMGLVQLILTNPKNVVTPTDEGEVQ